MDIIPGITLDALEAEIPIIELKCLKGKPYGEIVFLGDFHLGSGNFSLSQFLQYVSYIQKHPEVKVVGMGDYVELASLSRYGASAKQLGTTQLFDLIQIFKPIKDRIIILLEGNHEERFWNATHGVDTITKSLADALRIKPLLPGPERGQLFIVKVTKGKSSKYYPVYAIHGYTRATVQKATQLRKIFENIHTALVVHAHIHQIYKDHRTYYSVRQEGEKFYLTVHEQHWLTTGCFVKNLGYAERVSYPVTKIGAPIVRFHGDKEALEIVDDPRVTYGIGTDGKSLGELQKETGLEPIDLSKYQIQAGFAGTEVIRKLPKKNEKQG